jgi:hypothetical protein
LLSSGGTASSLRSLTQRQNQESLFDKLDTNFATTKRRVREGEWSEGGMDLHQSEPSLHALIVKRVIADRQKDNFLPNDEILLTDAALILIDFGFLCHHNNFQ